MSLAFKLRTFAATHLPEALHDNFYVEKAAPASVAKEEERERR